MLSRMLYKMTGPQGAAEPHGQVDREVLQTLPDGKD